MTHAVLKIDNDEVIGPVRPRLFGALVEHLGRAVYDGIYEPGHPSANEAGFREDVMQLVRELGVTTLRYPGGNFVSGYRWEDGVGHRRQRPRRLSLAWHALETNEVGLHEFAAWAEAVRCELMLVLNLGTRGTAEALELLEYANVRSGTALADKRAADGTAEPFGIRIWCLGNEMDGPWQLGHDSAEAYAARALTTARAMRMLDPGLELVACGSSNPEMPTFGSWDRTVLERTFEEIDAISCHAYYWERSGDIASFVASAVHMDRYIDAISAVIESVRATVGSRRPLGISFDEWGVWYMDRFPSEAVTGIEHWPPAPRLLEDRYSVADAVVSGSLLVSLLRHADCVTAACLSQLVNVIAPIMTEPGGPAWRQTTFFPFAATARLARGEVVGSVIDAKTYETARFGHVPLIDAATTYDRATGRGAAFLVNRDTAGPAEVTLNVCPSGSVRVSEAWSLSDPDPMAGNSRDEPERIVLQPNSTARSEGSRIEVRLPALSWSAVGYEIEGAGQRRRQAR